MLSFEERYENKVKQVLRAAIRQKNFSSGGNIVFPYPLKYHLRYQHQHSYVNQLEICKEEGYL